MNTVPSHASLGLLLTALLLTGCADSGPPVGQVEGTITLDGKPLPNARVTFTPLFPEGSPAYGETDQQGRYAMRYQTDRPGVLLGKHRVEISTWEILTNPDGSKQRVPELVPEKYNNESELEVDVVKGRQTLDFELEGE
jgi:hypothetical protein